MKHYKQLICGVLIGATATLSVTALAELIANPNPYPVKVNGETVQIEGYNINDSTYFKIRDVAAAIGGIDVDFVDGAVTIKTAETTPTATPTPAPTPVANKNLEPLPELPIEKREGKEYVSMYDINDMLEDIGLGQYKLAGHEFFKKSDLLNSLLSDIPLYEHDIELIPLDYYTSTITPLIDSLR